MCYGEEEGERLRRGDPRGFRRLARAVGDYSEARERGKQLAVGLDTVEHDLTGAGDVLLADVLEGLGDVLLEEGHDAGHADQLRLLDGGEVALGSDQTDLGVDVFLQARGALRLQDVEVALHLLDRLYLGRLDVQ